MSIDILREHDNFFKSFIDMVPRELYNTNEDNLLEMNTKYYKHRKVPLTTDEKKILSVKRKADKYSISNTLHKVYINLLYSTTLSLTHLYLYIIL